MDFSKAIRNVHFKEVDKIIQEVNLKLSNNEWRKINNAYAHNAGVVSSEPEGGVGTEAYYFDYEMFNAIYIFAEVKKHFETRGWRVLTVQNGSSSKVSLQLYK